MHVHAVPRDGGGIDDETFLLSATFLSFTTNQPSPTKGRNIEDVNGI